MIETVDACKVRFVRERDVDVVVVGNGRRRNALGAADWHDLAAGLEARRTDPEIRAVVVRGDGADFSAGSDIHEWVRAEPDHVQWSFEAMERAFTAVEALPVPVISAVRGVAYGAGCQLALASDLRVMARTARIGMPIARFGILASESFARRVLAPGGSDTANLLLLTGRVIGADEAYRRGLATAVCEPEDLDRAVAALVGDVSRLPREAVAAAKASIAGAGGRATAGQAARHRAPRVAWAEFARAVRRFPRLRSPGGEEDGSSR